MKLTQTQIILGLMIKKFISAKNNAEKWELLAPHDFMGECYFPETNKHYFVSYEASARLSTLFKENPELLFREKIEGRSGAKYYGYRLNNIAVTIGKPKLEEVVELILQRKIKTK